MLAFYLCTVGESLSDKEKVVWIYNNYCGYMLDAAYAVCRDRHLAEDAVHETFLRLMKYLDRIDENNYKANLGILRIMTKNITINLYKKNYRLTYCDMDELDIVDIESNVEAQVIEKEMDKVVLDILRKLPKKTFDVICLHCFRKFKLAEIAEILNITVESVKKRLARGKNELRFYLRGMQDEIQ